MSTQYRIYLTFENIVILLIPCHDPFLLPSVPVPAPQLHFPSVPTAVSHSIPECASHPAGSPDDNVRNTNAYNAASGATSFPGGSGRADAPDPPCASALQIYRLSIQDPSLNVMGRRPSKGKKDLPSISKTCPRSSNITLSRIMCRTFPPCHSSSGYSPIRS